MTQPSPDPLVVPSWMTVEWTRFAAHAAEHYCVRCSEYLVPREGAVCPCCSPTADFEGQMP